PALEVHRMYGRSKSTVYDMVLVILELSPEGKRIFDIKAVCQISGLRIEKPYKRSSPNQCHNCQSYGHSSRNCHIRSRCVKCLGDHHTKDCPRPKDPKECTEAPGCVLCGTLGHTASYGGCPQRPRPQTRRGSKKPKQAVQTSPAPPVHVVENSPPPPNAWVKPPTMTSATKPRPAAPPVNKPSPPVNKPSPVHPQAKKVTADKADLHAALRDCLKVLATVLSQLDKE
ncbi:hypothetical protein JYU34_008899, partial [Plutella xylostella]